MFSGTNSKSEMCNLYFMYHSIVDDGGFQFCDVEENKDVKRSLSSVSSNVSPESNNRDELLEPMVLPKSSHDHGLQPYQLM